MENIEESELIYELFKAKNSNNREEIITLLRRVSISNPNLYAKALAIFKRKYIRSSIAQLNLLSLLDLKRNMDSLEEAVLHEEWELNNNTFSAKALKKIYFHNEEWNKNSQLAKQNYTKLTVADFLDILSYSISFADTITGESSENIHTGITILKGIDLALNHKEHDRPIIKSTHLAVDILAHLATDMEQNPNKHNLIRFGATAVHLAIKFLTK